MTGVIDGFWSWKILLSFNKVLLKNSFIIILFCVCLFLFGCKKNDTAGDSTPKISFDFQGKHVQYSGKATGVQYEGVALIPIPITTDSSEFQYQVLAGTDDRNYILIVFNGPYPLQKSNISQLKYYGVGYGKNGVNYSCEDCNLHITIDDNNLLTGTFSGPSQYGQSLSFGNGTFKNVVIQ